MVYFSNLVVGLRWSVVPTLEGFDVALCSNFVVGVIWLVVPTLGVRVGVEMAVVPDLKVALRLSVVSTWRGSS